MEKATRPTVSKATEDWLYERFCARPHWQQSLGWVDWLGIQARKRVSETPGLDAYQPMLLDFARLPYDKTVHLMWLATASVPEILAWCEDIAWRVDIDGTKPPPLYAGIMPLWLFSIILDGLDGLSGIAFA